ncbi:putative membrane protein [Methylophaga frappieri]|uniref:Putative membrane protein n=1 Tax=Methylophaga frappieri (strain ATCC BAA-2434 / DSM 25690 / JAM7) TaxID=754477 RepID=I1YEL7_METFJ|nr:VTT domain-containing protein [Methylophaga frappieri]AFJ01360.1 putative membrane protein [Methylophaga frappieri]
MQKISRFIKCLMYSRHMLWGVAFASFLESLIVPIPLEAILLPLMQARRDRLWLISLMALFGCLLGAMTGYLVGYYLFGLVGDYVIGLLSSPAQFLTVSNAMHDQGFWFVFSVGVTPIPFQIAMLAAGVTGFSFTLYLLATLLARGIRYFGLGLLVWLFGNRAQRLFERNKLKASITLLALIAGIWLTVYLLR